MSDFLGEVFKSYSSFEESICAVASWLGLGLDHRGYLNGIITQSLSLSINERIAWKLIDKDSKSDSYKEMFTRVTKKGQMKQE